MNAIRAWLLLAALATTLAGGEVVLAGATETRLPGLRLLSQADRDATSQLAIELSRAHEGLIAWLGRNVKPLPAGLPALPVLVFADRASFQAYAHSNARNVATAHAEGFYSGDGTPGGGKLVIFRDGGRELSTVRHELLHYALDQILPARSGQPVWFNEGLAVCAEDAWFDPGQVRLSQVPMQRQALLRSFAADGGTPLASITALAADGWLERAGADRDEAERQYAASYGAVLYLLNVHPDRFWDFLRRMAGGETHDRAYAATLAAIPGGLDQAWRTWVAQGAWEAARQLDGSGSASAAVEHGMSWLPEHLPPGDATEAARWLSGAARGFAATPGYELDAAEAWLQTAQALNGVKPAKAGAAAEAASVLFAGRNHLAGQAKAMLQACRAWGDDQPGGDWVRAAQQGRLAVQWAEAVGPDGLRASAYTAYGACFIPGRAGNAPDGGDGSAEAERALRRARELYRTAGERDHEASTVLLMAQALSPADGTEGDWAGCIALADEAEVLWRGLPDQQAVRADLARAMAVRAGLNRPDRNLGGDWAIAAALYGREAELIGLGDDRRRLRNRIDRATCLLGMGDNGKAAMAFAEAERSALAVGDQGLAGYTAYQAGWSLQSADPGAAFAAFERAAPRYRAAGKLREEAMAVAMAAQVAGKADVASVRIAALYGTAANLERQRGDLRRAAGNLYQQAWHSEPARQAGVDPTQAAGLYAAAAELWQETEPTRAAQAYQQRARVLTPASGDRTGWTEAIAAWRQVGLVLAALPDASKHAADRGHALHQQAWCLIRGDGSRMTKQARELFSEAVKLQREGGDENGARTSSSWIRD